MDRRDKERAANWDKHNPIGFGLFCLAVGAVGGVSMAVDHLMSEPVPDTEIERYREKHADETPKPVRYTGPDRKFKGGKKLPKGTIGEVLGWTNSWMDHCDLKDVAFYNQDSEGNKHIYLICGIRWQDLEHV